MKLITKEAVIKEVPRRWKETYFLGGIWKYGEDKERIYNNLVKAKTEEEINTIIGNTSWVDIKCNECGKYVTEVVQLGEEPDYESYTADICFECLQKALSLGE